MSDNCDTLSGGEDASTSSSYVASNGAGGGQSGAEGDDGHRNRGALERLHGKAVDLVRKYAGEQVAEHLLRAQVDVENQVRSNVSRVNQQVFGQLFSQDESGVETSQADLWKTRSSSWIDHMTPQGRVWLEASLPTSLLGRDADLSWSMAADIRMEEELEHQLQLDLPRTFPGLGYFEDPDVLASFERILRGTALACPEVGYVQGMNFLAGYLMLHCKTDSETHRLMVELLTNPKYQLRGVFEEGLPTLRALSATLKSTVAEHDKELYLHFEELGFVEYFFAFQWISTVFTYSMPFDALQHLWDQFFTRGWEGFFAIALVVLVDRREELLVADFDRACAVIKESTSNPRQDFYERASNVRFSSKLLREIRGAYQNSPAHSRQS